MATASIFHDFSKQIIIHQYWLILYSIFRAPFYDFAHTSYIFDNTDFCFFINRNQCFEIANTKLTCKILFCKILKRRLKKPVQHFYRINRIGHEHFPSQVPQWRTFKRKHNTTLISQHRSCCQPHEKERMSAIWIENH